LIYQAGEAEETKKSVPSFDKLDVTETPTVFIPRRKDKKKDNTPIVPAPREKESPTTVKVANNFIKSTSELNPVNYSEKGSMTEGQKRKMLKSTSSLAFKNRLILKSNIPIHN
jgi:hypothetical protein